MKVEWIIFGGITCVFLFIYALFWFLSMEPLEADYYQDDSGYGIFLYRRNELKSKNNGGTKMDIKTRNRLNELKKSGQERRYRIQRLVAEEWVKERRLGVVIDFKSRKRIDNGMKGSDRLKLLKSEYSGDKRK